MKQSFLFLFFIQIVWANCNTIPPGMQPYISPLTSHIKDLQKNNNSLKGLCLNEIHFKEGKYRWHLLLITNKKEPFGPFWFLPHDNENTAFTSALYATHKYGGGFLMVLAHDNRYYQGQDPNRNFSNSKSKNKSCSQQHSGSSGYTHIIFSIIQFYNQGKYPVLTLHNNKNSWYGGIGSGGVSILNSSKNVQSYPAYRDITSSSKGLKDEDNLIYIAGKHKYPNKLKLNSLLGKGINVKYEVVNQRNNDCSLSNYVVLNYPKTEYYNIETQHGDAKTQKIMIDKLFEHLNSLK